MRSKKIDSFPIQLFLFLSEEETEEESSRKRDDPGGEARDRAATINRFELLAADGRVRVRHMRGAVNCITAARAINRADNWPGREGPINGNKKTRGILDTAPARRIPVDLLLLLLYNCIKREMFVFGKRKERKEERSTLSRRFPNGSKQFKPVVCSDKAKGSINSRHRSIHY